MTSSRFHSGFLSGLLLTALCSPTVDAAAVFSGVIDLDYTSSIAGAPKGTRYFFDLTLDGSAQDIVHFASANGFGGLTFDGFYNSSGGAPVLDFQMRLDPASPAGSTFDPSGLTYDFSRSTIITVDANAAVGSTVPFNERLSIGIPVITPGSPIMSVTLNLYNSSSLFDPVSPGAQQLILDASTAPPGSPQGPNGFTLDDLFLNGLESLGGFQSTRVRTNGEPEGLVDPVYLNGPSGAGTFGAGTIKSFRTVPEPGPTMLLGVLGFGTCVLLRGRGGRRATS